MILKCVSFSQDKKNVFLFDYNWPVEFDYRYLHGLESGCPLPSLFLRKHEILPQDLTKKGIALSYEEILVDHH